MPQDDRYRLMRDEERANFDTLVRNGYSEPEAISMATNPTGRLDAARQPQTRYRGPPAPAADRVAPPMASGDLRQTIQQYVGQPNALAPPGRGY